MDYPLKKVSLDNYKPVTFNYTKLNDIKYDYCSQAAAVPLSQDITMQMNGSQYYRNTMIDDSLKKYKEDNNIQKNQYLINIKLNNLTKFRYFILYAKTCDTVTMDLVEKIDE